MSKNYVEPKMAPPKTSQDILTRSMADAAQYSCTAAILSESESELIIRWSEGETPKHDLVYQKPNGNWILRERKDPA